MALGHDYHVVVSVEIQTVIRKYVIEIVAYFFIKIKAPYVSQV